MARQRGKVRSQAQWRWAFVTRQRFAHRWARARKRSHGKVTGYRTLPARKGIRRR
ncbi:hypothetical protein [Streptomyces sp. 020-2-3H-GM]|uniref:hypothetical protein n=1 Tax=Streptomyces sp. 020-2-3H-GM TaxID=2789258 RepID=UPI00397F8AE6